MENYHSILDIPDLRPHFQHMHEWFPSGTLGHTVQSDWADKDDNDPVFRLPKICGFMMREEVAILYHCVQRLGGRWLDIGAHSGWTASHIAEAGAKRVVSVDPEFWNHEFYQRFADNTDDYCPGVIMPWAGTSEEFFKAIAPHPEIQFDGVMIDGNHDWGFPLADAMGAYACLAPTGVVVFHDFTGGPIQEGATFLLDKGFRVRPYLTPYGVAVCWRGDFEPPLHTPDPIVLSQNYPARLTHFDWNRRS